MTGPEKDIIGELTLAVNGVLERENQRAIDKVEEDRLRKRLRDADEKRWDSFEDRLDRIQAEAVRMRLEVEQLPTIVETRATAAALATKKELDEAVTFARELARQRDARTAKKELDEAVTFTRELARQRDARTAVGKFLTRTGRIILSAVVVAIIAALMVVVYTQRHDHNAAIRDTAMIAAFATLCVPFVILLLVGGQPSNRTKRD